MFIFICFMFVFFCLSFTVFMFKFYFLIFLFIFLSLCLSFDLLFYLLSLALFSNEFFLEPVFFWPCDRDSRGYPEVTHVTGVSDVTSHNMFFLFFVKQSQAAWCVMYVTWAQKVLKFPSFAAPHHLPPTTMQTCSRSSKSPPSSEKGVNPNPNSKSRGPNAFWFPKDEAVLIAFLLTKAPGNMTESHMFKDFVFAEAARLVNTLC